MSQARVMVAHQTQDKDTRTPETQTPQESYPVDTINKLTSHFFCSIMKKAHRLDVGPWLMCICLLSRLTIVHDVDGLVTYLA